MLYPTSKKSNPKIFLLLLPLFILGIVYSFILEPMWLEVTHHTIHLPVKKSIKIAHLADFHSTEVHYLEKKVFGAIEQEEPDLIAITGDIVAKNGTIQGYKEVLKRLSAPLGVWFVKGNWENWIPIKNEKKFFESLNINFLLNENAKIRDDLILVGLDDWPSGKPEIEKSFLGTNRNKVIVALIHSPKFNEKIHKRVSLTLAGHTHGGQIRIPFWGPLWLPAGSGKYISGWYDFGVSKMYVSRGIGTSILPIRLFARPEVAFITIKPM